jgi:hypothetical protein
MYIWLINQGPEISRHGVSRVNKVLSKKGKSLLNTLFKLRTLLEKSSNQPTILSSIEQVFL